MLKIVTNSETLRAAPVLECEYCQSLIEKAALAWVLWQPDIGIPFYLHKKCIRDFEKKTPNINWIGSELETFMFRLMHNIKADFEKGNKYIAILNQLS